jgi:RNA polymerase sigma-70 factor (ECF subfamily)
MNHSPQQITKLLIEWGNEDQAALDQLMPLVYAELHRMAMRYMKQQNRDHILQTTALIHQAYVRLIGDCVKNWENRAHCFGAAKAMRHILIDHARSYLAAKRGGGMRPIPLNEAMVISGGRIAEIVALDDALTHLAELDSRQSQIVELRYFGGLSVEETAETLKVSPETVLRDWRAAKAWP